MTMRSIYLAAAVLAATLLASCGEKKVNLLESDSMDRWKVVVNEDSLGRTAFTIEEGILKISGMPFGYIRSAQSFSDYTLSLEWRWTGEKGVDGGIFNFLQGEDKVWPLGVQFQMTPEDMGVLMGGIPLEGVEGPFYKKLRLVESSPERPVGEWNEVKFSCKGGQLEAWLNGVLVNKAVCEAKEGYIGFQSEGGPMEIRNLYVTSAK